MTNRKEQNHSLNLWYKQPAFRWEEALPIGNGRLGGMVFGGVAKERIQLNEDTLWSGFPRDTNNYEALRYLKRARELIAEKRYVEAEQLIESKMLGKNTESYQPMGDWYVEQHFAQGSAELSHYNRTLDIDAGIATTRWQIGQADYCRETFVSATDQVLCTRYEAHGDGLLELTSYLESSVHYEVAAEGGDAIVLYGQCPSHVADNYLGDHPKAVQYEAGRGITFQTKLTVTAEGGTVSVDGDNQIKVVGASSVTFLLSAATSFERYNLQPAASKAELSKQNDTILAAASAHSYEMLRARHVQDHRQLFQRVQIDLGQTPNSLLPTDERLEAYKRGEQDPQLEALYFQYGRYLLMASSRPGTQPANLQGIWNDRVQPPWNSDYTTNINTQMNYWPAELGNLSECHEPLFQMIEELSESGARTAAIHYNSAGWVTHHNVDLWRTSTPTAGHPSWAFWPLGGVWLTQHLWEHYLYNPDESFLRERAYPLMKGAALFCLDWLQENGEGQLMTSPSTSPENKFLTADGEASSVAESSAMDITLIRELFEHCILAASFLQTDEAFAEQVNAALQKLSPLHISPDGLLQEWHDHFEEHEPGHRHVSHLYGLYPGTTINETASPELVEAGRLTLESRIKSGGGHTGWSCAWLINLYARLKDAEASYRFIHTLLARSTHPNLFDDHPPFQIDGNFGGAAGIAELLLQSHLGGIELLPALPLAWPTGYVKGIKARGGFIVELQWQDSKITEGRIYSTHGSTCKLIAKETLLVYSADGTLIDGARPFATKKNEWYTIKSATNKGE
ncbi:glycosyl hydrolase family 95 catalytic domain-containing protein [Paenibacillus paridis]|uniref:glycoside hydrolase family 95 protein n=1 Tax=Paenibacillus paridis TaxID=2583376 RepID=UPI0011226F62|nr:glycoside hydrolase family 95 protein [Paenibacillus paridis]